MFERGIGISKLLWLSVIFFFQSLAWICMFLRAVKFFLHPYNNFGIFSGTLTHSTRVVGHQQAFQSNFHSHPRGSGPQVTRQLRKLEKAGRKLLWPMTTPPHLLQKNYLPAPPTPMPSSSMIMQRLRSMDNIVQKMRVATGDGDHSLPPHTRRLVSWSGSLVDSLNPAKKDIKHLGKALGMSRSPSSYMLSDRRSKQFSANSHNFGDELPA